jgi:hypothetical protein
MKIKSVFLKKRKRRKKLRSLSCQIMLLAIMEIFLDSSFSMHCNLSQILFLKGANDDNVNTL